jgi:hypothetical protein
VVAKIIRISTSRKGVACTVSPVGPVLRVVPSLSWQKREITNAHFLSGNCGGDLVSGNNAADGPAKNGIFEPFIYKNDHFAKTGSGQT